MRTSHIVHIGSDTTVFADILNGNIEYVSLRYKGCEMHFYGDEVKDFLDVARSFHRFHNMNENQKSQEVA